MKILNTQIIPTPTFGMDATGFGRHTKGEAPSGETAESWETYKVLVLTDGGLGRENGDLAVYEGIATLPLIHPSVYSKKEEERLNKAWNDMSMRVAEGGRKHRWEEARQYFNIHEHEYRA